MTDNFIFDVIAKFNDSSIVDLNIKRGGSEIALKKAEGCVASATIPSTISSSVASPVASVPASTAVTTEKKVTEEVVVSEKPSTKESDDSITIKSPLVGTFYRAPSPDSPAYAEPGKTISKGHPLCIIEAMKMMNTFEAEYDCTILEVLVSNGDLVEYDQPLFVVKKM